MVGLRGSHGGTTGLQPEGVTKFERVARHDNTKCREEGTSSGCVRKYLWKHGEGVISVDVRIAAYGISSEQFCSGWQGWKGS